MFTPSRRLFLGASVAGLASYPLFGEEPKKLVNPKAVKEDAAFQPGTLFLTWHRDPTTTMVVQWVGVRGETSDTNIYYNPVTPTSQFGFLAPWSVGSRSRRSRGPIH